jgi:hypothetical protein
MKTIIELNSHDIKKILAEYFQVQEDKVCIESAGYDKGDGPYPGTGYYCHIGVEKK